MSHSEPTRPAGRRTRAVVAALVVVALVGVLVRPGWATSSSADGAVVDGVTVFDDVPAVANLDPKLLGAVRLAATDAASAGVVLFVNSGWRTRGYQQRLLDEAVARYGSEAQAARLVATPDMSPHVAGDAVDIGHSDAKEWLSEHGAAYGLCQIYANEPWHFELRPASVEHGCPQMYADPTHDPRMQHEHTTVGSGV